MSGTGPSGGAAAPSGSPGPRRWQPWAWNALKTIRGQTALFTLDYGNELQALTGRAFSQEVKESEAVRYVRECLSVNPYITGVRQIAVDFSGARLSISCAVDTIYGEVKVDVSGL